MLSTLKITNVRNLSVVEMDLTWVNVIVGQNGSGKTSLLEAVFLLSRGKSFRHHEPKRYISHTKRACTVWAKTASSTLAVQKTLDDKGMASTLIKKDGHTVPSQSVLSFALPTLIIDPVGVMDLEEGSTTRRQLFDWLVFHVKHEFHAHWQSYQRLLKQRNGLLKMPDSRHHLMQIHAWDHQLSHYASQLHVCRQAVFEEWQAYFQVMVGRFLPQYADKVSLVYQAGFDQKRSLFDILTERVQADIQLGHTRVGAHRADVTVSFDVGGIKEQAVNVLSRGEKKLLIMAMKLSQIQMVCQYGGMPVVLIDDLDAELDDVVMSMLLDELMDLPCQLIITTLSDKTAQHITQRYDDKKRVKVFHVEQGRLSVSKACQN